MQSSLKDFYMKVLCQCYSENGRLLVCGNNYGELLIFDVEKVLKDEDLQDEALKSSVRQQVSTGAIYCLTSVGDFLLAGGVGEVLGFRWSAVQEGKIEVEWAVRLPMHGGLNKPEVNAIAFSDSERKMYLAAGDNKIYIYELETRHFLGTLDEHQDYVHDLAINKQGNELYSAGEDGAVKLWDLRSKKTVCSVDIKKHDKLRSASGSTWVGAVALDESEEWLIVAGGHKPTALHTKSMTPAIVFSEVEQDCFVAEFCNDMVTLAGEGGKVYHFSMAGELRAAVPSSSTAIYAVALHPAKKCCTTSGASNRLDLSRTLLYNDLILTV